MINWIASKLKASSLQKTPLNKWKGKQQTEEKIFAISNKELKFRIDQILGDKPPSKISKRFEQILL